MQQPVRRPTAVFALMKAESGESPSMLLEELCVLHIFLLTRVFS
jgi:hypothetical protein